MMRRLARAGAIAVAVLCVAVVGLEATLQILHRVVSSDAVAPPAADGHVTVLCIGDSHTWGMGKGYPAALATALAARSPRYRVLNLGVPGSNTAQLRRRFDEYLDTVQPRVVVVWSGLNNAWNGTDTDAAAADTPPPSVIDRLLDASRIVRLIRVVRHQNALRRTLDESGTLVAPEMYRQPDDPKQTFRRNTLGTEDVQHHVPAGELPEARTTAVTEADIRWLGERARARGVPMAVITYPLPGGQFLATNVGIRQAAEALAIPVVDTGEALKRLNTRAEQAGEPLPKAYDSSVHPTQVFYDEIGALVLETLDRMGVLQLEPAALK